jgi:L-asparaginase
MSVASDRPQVRIVAAGGTIASMPTAAGGLAEPVYRSGDLVGGVHALSDWAQIESEDFSDVLSSQLSLEQVHGLARHLATLLDDRPDLAGLVVTHGTGTMEESAFLADLVIDDPRPVVFTGAMRAGADSDRELNLLDAVRVAGSGAARGKGVLIVMNSTIHAARTAYKSHTTAVETFVASEGGPLGHVYPDRVHFTSAPLLRQHLPAASPVLDVDVIKFVVGMDDRYVRCSIDAGADAIVIEGSGLGNVNHRLAAAIVDALGQGVVVVLCSRAPKGRTHAYYGAGAGGGALARRGCLLSALSGPKTRILLMLALAITRDPAELQALLDPAAG